MKDNIYDYQISELILRLDNNNAGTNNSPRLSISSSIGSTGVVENYNNPAVVFTSEVLNVPAGYTVKSSTHVISYPIAVPDTVGSSTTLSGPGVSVIVGAVGSTYTVTTSVTLEHNTEVDIVLAGTIVIASASPMYYGVKAYSGTPDITALSIGASTETSFSMTTSIVGRIYIVLPIGLPALTSVVDPNGYIYPISDFTSIIVGSLVYYQLSYDTQLTGAYQKTFKFNF